MPEKKEIFLVGFASGVGSGLPGTAQSPARLQHSEGMVDVQRHQPVIFHWQSTIQGPSERPANKRETVKQLCGLLSDHVADLVSQSYFFGVLGGDHSSAIGTWSGAAASLKKAQKGALGLIWIDAHMDSHTFETTPSGNIHGMPLAALLGHGWEAYTHLSGFSPALKPEHLCLVGVRSYEPEEAALLKKLGVRIFFMDEVARRGVSEVLAEARQIVTQGTAGYGLSIDIDSMDPLDAPGTGVREPNGIRAKDLIRGLGQFADDPAFLGFEIAEFDPTLDINDATEKLVPELIAAMTVRLG